MSPVRLRDRSSGPSSGWTLLLLTLAFMVAAFFALRYRGQWIEQDTSGMTAMITANRTEGALIPSTGRIYTHGFAYQAATVYLLELTGVRIQQIQAVLWPLLAAFALALTALAFFIQSSRAQHTAVLAGFLLFFQGDLVFTILRGSHEKLDWPLVMVALALLIKGAGRPLRSLILHVFLFYIVVFAVIATNVFFASTFIVAIVLSLLLGVLIEAVLHRRLGVTGDLRRLLWVALSCTLLLFIVAVYLYPPALANLRALANILDQVSTVMLGFAPTDSPYVYITYGWIDGRAYLGLTLFTWLLIVFSFLEWLRWGWQILRGQETVGIRRNLVWLLYAGFAIQVAIGVGVDLSGVLAQNLQLRIFPGFTVMATVLLAHRLERIFAGRQGQGTMRPVLVVASVILFGWFSLASVLKATNEPILSNKWLFYSTSEVVAMAWTDDSVESAYIWTGHDERIYEAGAFRRGGPSENGNTFRGYIFGGYERYVLFSEQEHVRGLRMGLAMPPTQEWNRIYDNGDVYLYHKRPQTLYQR